MKNHIRKRSRALADAHFSASTARATANTISIASRAVRSISLAGKMKPYRPESRNSTVYEYLMPSDLAQSSEAPAAGYSSVPDAPTWYCLPSSLRIFCENQHYSTPNQFRTSQRLLPSPHRGPPAPNPCSPAAPHDRIPTDTEYTARSCGTSEKPESWRPSAP